MKDNLKVLRLKKELKEREGEISQLKKRLEYKEERYANRVEAERKLLDKSVDNFVEQFKELQQKYEFEVSVLEKALKEKKGGKESQFVMDNYQNQTKISQLEEDILLKQKEILILKEEGKKLKSRLEGCYIMLFFLAWLIISSLWTSWYR